VQVVQFAFVTQRTPEIKTLFMSSAKRKEYTKWHTQMNTSNSPERHFRRKELLVAQPYLCNTQLDGQLAAV
jgi:hypothetical protein